MIAIPVDEENINATSSKLFGNVKAFALYNSLEDRFTFVKNSGSGSGIKTAKFLKALNVSDTVYSYMGDGPFKTLYKNNINVHYIGKESAKLFEIVINLKNNEYKRVDASNASIYLDAGTATANCECTCTH